MLSFFNKEWQHKETSVQQSQHHWDHLFCCWTSQLKLWLCTTGFYSRQLLQESESHWLKETTCNSHQYEQICYNLVFNGGVRLQVIESQISICKGPIRITESSSLERSPNRETFEGQLAHRPHFAEGCNKHCWVTMRIQGLLAQHLWFRKAEERKILNSL